MTLSEIAAACRSKGLEIAGAFHSQPKDDLPTDCQTLVMLCPREPGFWARIEAEPEFTGPDPIDRWSERVIGQLAHDCDALPLFPFGGPPYQPFVRWAFRTGRVWQSPVSLMVHDKMGLFLSFRGALAFHQRLDLPEADNPSPCERCDDKPCLTACPASALTGRGYNLAACHDFLDGAEGKDCLNAGCAVRRACPVSQGYGRLERQSAHHMRYFHK